jgi:sugar lactone lactonase YvrE
VSLIIALDVRAELGECPIWSVEEQALYFVDIKGKALHRFAPATGAHRTFSMPEEIGCIGFGKGGGFIAGFRSGLWLLDAEGNRLRKLADNPEDQRTSRFNEGRVDPAAILQERSMNPRTAEKRISTATTPAGSRAWPRGF